ncbi:Flp family type IVb pilin [Ornithinimicrobium cavernae]|uniref:Flp family type IVb pilin n=1 Tax=Ornithinimicrobium cavernae TaxID=2666047 RepID=UPI000D68DEE6|nr:Flp family type IVb pilin [Ornithinimicrobium cavernae]
MAALAYFVTTLRAKFEDSEKGATAVEYGLMVALIAVAIIGTVTALGGQLNALFTEITAAL